jgi:hypothetical protein
MKMLDAFKPAVAKSVLLFLAGFVWLCMGSMLVILAYFWLVHTPDRTYIPFLGGGFILGLIVHHFGFLKIVDKNIARIRPMTDKRCLFSFITWKSYLIILVMVVMGSFLRHSSIPKHFLAILYSGIGLALILSSIRYIRAFLKELTNKEPF